jgi:hypothetical protein
MILSARFKLAFKTALAMAIAFGIALSLNWEKPYWAGLAVAMCSLGRVGDSLNKSLLRILGTFCAIPVALILLSLFPQSRWSFLLALSGYVAFCTYMIGSTTRWYFWFVAGFVVPILTLDTLAAGVSGTTSFTLAIVRAQETLLGIVVYGLVEVLVWPRSSRRALEKAVQDLVGLEHRFFKGCIGVLQGHNDGGSLAKIRTQAIQSFTQLGTLVDGAELDSYTVWEMRHEWRQCLRQLGDIGRTMEAWRMGFKDLQGLDTRGLMRGFQGFAEEIEARFAAIEGMLTGQPPGHRPATVDLALDESAFSAHPPFQRAAFLLARDQMADMERKIRALFRTVGDLGGFERRRVSGVVDTHPALPAIPDPDRLASVVRHFASLWLTFLAVIYVPDIPIAVALIMIVNSPSMMLSSRLPYVPVPMLFKPVFAALLFAGLMHIVVMPHLSGFAGLGTMIFAATFLICYWNAEPQQRLGRSVGLALLCVLPSITNDQSYSFLRVVNYALVLVLFFGVLIFTTHFPISFRPERVCLRMLTRFFRSASFLVAMRAGHALSGSGWWHRRQVAFHLQEVTKLPQKLVTWQRVLPKAALGSTPPENVQLLIAGLQDLSYRIQALYEARKQPPKDAVLNVFLKDMQTWIAGIQKVFDGLAEDPGSQVPEMLREQLTAMLHRFEGQIEAVLDKPDAVKISLEEGERMYRLLGAYRGVSKSAVDCAASTRAIDWNAMREERF